MLRTFNCGIGAVVICSRENKDKVLQLLSGANPVVIGSVTKLAGQRVQVANFEKVMDLKIRPYIPQLLETVTKPLKKVGVLISGSGTNLQALIDATNDLTQHIGAEIVLVISNKPNVEGLKRAERANIKTKVKISW